MFVDITALSRRSLATEPSYSFDVARLCHVLFFLNKFEILFSYNLVANVLRLLFPPHQSSPPPTHTHSVCCVMLLIGNYTVSRHCYFCGPRLFLPPNMLPGTWHKTWPEQEWPLQNKKDGRSPYGRQQNRDKTFCVVQIVKVQFMGVLSFKLDTLRYLF